MFNTVVRKLRRCSHLAVLLPMAKPAVEQRADMIRPALEQGLGGVAHGGQQVGIAHQVGDLELQQASLTGAKHFAGAAQFKILFGDDKTVVGFAHDAQALTSNL